MGVLCCGLLDNQSAKDLNLTQASHPSVKEDHQGPRVQPTKKSRMPLRLTKARNGDCPDKAVVGCQADDGTNIVVGRAAYKGGMHPGKLNPKHSSLYISYGGDEIACSEYEILVQEVGDNVHWVAAHGQLPPGHTVVKTGYEANGDPLYVARGIQSVTARFFASSQSATCASLLFIGQPGVG